MLKRLARIGVVIGMSLSGLLFSQIAKGTDIPIYPTGPIYRITPALVWGTSTQPGFNNNYFFTPININESVCVYVYNNNTTNPHTFSASISITGNPSEITPADGTWQIAANSTSLNALTAPGLPAGLGASVTGAANVSINFSNSSTQPGSPDTANVTIVQTSGNCFSGNQFIGSAPQTVASVTPLQVASDGLNQAYWANPTTQTNPGAAVELVQVNANNGSRSLYFDRAVISSSAAAAFNIVLTNTVGATCTAVTVTQMRINSNNGSGSVANSACGTLPASAGIVSLVQFGATSYTVIDLKGFIAPSGTTTGIMIQTTGAVTGTVNVALFWYEK